MTGVLVHCAYCGYTGTVDWLLNVEPGATARITFSNSSVSCPNCGRAARILDGTFEYRDEVLSVLAAPAYSLEKLRQLQTVLLQVREQVATNPQAAIARVEQVDAPTANLLRRALASKELLGITAVLTVLLAAIAILVTLYVAGADKITPEDVQRIVDRTIEQMPEPSPTPAPPPAPGSAPPAAPAPPESLP